jgi:hypothetical protein
MKRIARLLLRVSRQMALTVRMLPLLLRAGPDSG